MLGATTRLEIGAAVARARSSEIYSLGLSKALGLPPGQTHRELKLLETAGLLRQVPSRDRRVAYERQPHPYWDFVLAAYDEEGVLEALEEAEVSATAAHDALRAGRSIEARERLRRACQDLQNYPTSTGVAAQTRIQRAYIQLLGLAQEVDDAVGDQTTTREIGSALLAVTDGLVAQAPRKPAHRRDLARAFQLLSALDIDVSDSVTAEELALRSLEISQELVAEYPDHPDYQRDVLVTYGRLCDLAREAKDLEAVHRLTAELLSTSQALACSAPGDVGYQHELGRAYERCSELASYDGEFDEANDYWQRALAVYDGLIGAPAGNPGAVVEAYRRLSHLALDRGDPAASKTALARAMSTPHAEPT